jgi:hypothetical protein
MEKEQTKDIGRALQGCGCLMILAAVMIPVIAVVGSLLIGAAKTGGV